MAAVADELVVAHPEGHVGTETLIALMAGLALILIGTKLFKGIVLPGGFPISHVIGLVLLTALVPFAGAMSPLVPSIGLTVAPFLTGLWETRVQRTSPRTSQGQGKEPATEGECTVRSPAVVTGSEPHPDRLPGANLHPGSYPNDRSDARFPSIYSPGKDHLVSRHGDRSPLRSRGMVPCTA